MEGGDVALLFMLLRDVKVSLKFLFLLSFEDDFHYGV